MNKSLIAGAIGAVLSMPSHAAFELLKTDNTTVTFGGYAKASVMYSKFSDGTPASNSVGRNYYVPSTVTVCTASCGDNNPVLDFTAKETRFNFGTKTELEGHTLTTYLEMDFLSSYTGDERVSNSNAPRVRHAYFTYDNWLFGQTYTTFQNTGALAETVDFLGPADGTVFNRQVQIRYTSGNWQFAAENPETTYSAYGSTGKVDEDTSVMPDLVARYNMKGDWGHLVVAGLVRQLRADTVDMNGNKQNNQTATGYGISVSGLFKVGSMDDFRFMVSGGDGMGRYVALNAINGANADADGGLNTISTVGGFAAYRHMWNDKLRSTVMYSGTFANNNDSGATGLTKSVQSWHANIMYSPVKPITFGVEYIFGERKLENGAKGSLDRLQFAAKYVF
ncbi:DcaP family trimeric outer membrane transporter [Gallaecimonas kandeliae]|uniref:DcaP family trimeric outer membrane transporter n=1 Tax=Gallaecimonas kandeliae TaxID=3029055 RepID=UPI0026493FAC|nr:DcaP family trimeric outer membrane transporter [Gallaecimonas kandeliae]WKE67305.1 DcaP family trimeric outer membrane transporter [Gallaecimonas kandeliae]